MVLFQFAEKYYTLLYELFGLFILLGISAHISERTRKLTRIIVILLLAESLSYYFERWTQSFEKMSLLRPMLTACVYSLYPLLLFLAVQLIDVEKKSRLKTFLLILPQIVSIPIYFTSQWTKLVCWFSEDNSFHRGPGLLGYLPYVLFIAYGLYFLYKNLFYFKRYTRRERIFTIYLTMLPMGIVLYNICFTTGDDYSAMFTSALLLYYISLYIHAAKTDPLTELFNRQSYYQDLKRGGKAISAVVSVDMNELKQINDLNGHQAGDEALRTIAVVLRDHCGNGGTVYRVGGDEFMILYREADEARVKADVEAMRESLTKTPYTCAFGYAMMGAGDRIHDVLKEADERMYADKKAIKSGRAESTHT